MALAPEQTGLGLRRRFTTDGVDPYDEIAWERRDARITNFLDGSIAFEQRDVEFPVSWSLNATNIVTQKYFRGTPGTPERESSLRQVVDRVCDTITAWGVEGGYFVDEREAETFRAELKHLMVTQKAAFNSPVWFNIGVKGVPQQASACFILSVDDTMDSILNWYREEGTIFKGGSGAGVNLSKIRSSAELLRGGGTASGPVSFMRGADASAGTIKSGGKTRRAAKMVILDVDHPDVEEFIWCKAREEQKARVLRDAGFDMDLDGRDSHSLQYQNANNSVRVTDAFMQAVVDDAEWQLKAVKSGEVLRTVRARDLLRQIAQATWECADPGMQFDTTINRWHTAANTARINASNPCFTADTLVHTTKGLIRFGELFDRANRGEEFSVYTHDVTNPAAPAQRVVATTPEAFLITGRNPIVRLTFDNGMELRCTPGHRLFTTNRGYVTAGELTATDQVRTLDLPAPAVDADHAMPVSSDPANFRQRGDHGDVLRFPEVWHDEFAHYLGWLIGDGSTAGASTVTVYGSAQDRTEILPRHAELLTWINGDRPLKVSEQANGTAQLRLSRRPFKRYLEALGVASVTGAHKTVPWAVEQAPPAVVASFLRGLFDADGCVRLDAEKGSYVGLGSISRPLLQGVQRLLSTFGIASHVYNVHDGGPSMPPGSDGSPHVYERKAAYDLRISAGSIDRFAAEIGFELSAKAARLRELVASRVRGPYAVDTTARLVARTDEGVELTYNLSEPRNHSYVANGLVVRNCSEYMHLDNSACNLASINLLKFLHTDGEGVDRFDVEGFRHTVEVVFSAQEILVGRADYPTDPIGENARKFRQLGLGYANLGALLMALGLPYDSDAGRAWAAAVTALMTGHAYATSAMLASRMGPFAGYAENAEPMLRVLAQHREAASQIDEELVPTELLSAAQQAWDTACDLGAQFGVRNSQASVLAPTGCLVGGTLVATDRGLVRLRSLGDPAGPQWQDLDAQVLTDTGAEAATKFYVNGLEQVVDVRTARGYRISGTTKHRIKVLDGAGAWVWRRFADLRPGDRVPLALGQLLGERQPVELPPLSDKMAWAGEHHVTVPAEVNAELAELVGYFMGDGSLHSRGLRLCVAAGDFDVVEHLQQLAKSLFGVQAAIRPQQGYVSVELDSVRLARWWQACGFAKHRPHEGHRGKGYVPHVPEALLHTNDAEVYRAFLRGLFEADGTVTAGYPSWTTARETFADEVQTLLLALGYVTTRKLDRSGRGSRLHVVRLLNRAANAPWLTEIGFLSARKAAKVDLSDLQQGARHDHIPVSRALLDRVAPANDRNRKAALMEHGRSGTITRRLATDLAAASGDAELTHLLGFFYDTIATAELGDEELTYDLSVPANVTYVANGFVSHNTIGLMMDCDTTGVEPDLGLVKTKKLVGGGTMQIVNQTIPRALRSLGYTPEQAADIIAYIDEEKTILGAPHLAAEHVAVFACSMGDNPIHYLGHVKMMGAVQPFISGAISKCVTGDSLVASADGLVRIGSLHHGEAPDTFRSHIAEVGSLDGTQKTDAFYYGGVRPVHEARLRSGQRITGTPNHRVLVARETGLDWVRLDQLAEGDLVAVRYGGELWSVVPARFDGFTPSAPHGSQKHVAIPTEMTEEVAFLLGAFASEGHITRANHTVHVTNSVPAVRERVAAAWRDLFGLEPRLVDDGVRCPSVVVASKTVVEFLDFLGCGGRASEKRIPDAVLTSPRPLVLAFLQGLALDAYTHVSSGGLAKWAICLDAPALLDDLQAVLANLGVVHARIAKFNKTYNKTYDEVYVSGEHARRLVELVPFCEPDKAARAGALAAIEPSVHNTADVVPIRPRDLYELLPAGKPGRGGHGVRAEFAYLCDPRTARVTRRTLERVAAVPGVVLPPWLQQLLDDDLHLSPVATVAAAGEREVFDLSVPATHAFVANGIVNHNTVNLPEEATVEDVEQLHLDAWRLGVKAIAIYRDNCKVAQPLSADKKAAVGAPAPVDATNTPAEVVTEVVERVVERVVKVPVREKLPRNRRGRTFSFRVADCKGFVNVGEYDDGRPGEVFLRVSKQGSTLAGIMDALAISVSHGLQYGVPLRSFVEAFTNMRFEPAGMTDDPDIRFASSLLDYIFRRLAVDYLSPSERAELNILTIEERTQPTLPGVEESITENVQGHDVVADPPSIESAAELAAHLEAEAEAAADQLAGPSAEPGPGPVQRSLLDRAGVTEPPTQRQNPVIKPTAKASDAPYCMQCGVQMQRAGSCHACPSCGSTSGCS